MPRTHLVVVCAIALGVHASAQESSSTAAAARFTALLEERQLEAAAARDPRQENRFVAALHIPGSQLLVISSVHPQPAALDHRVAQRQYREAYTDLHGSGAEGRLFVMDLQANGLRRTREDGAPFDIVYRNGIDQISYDGGWKQQKLAEREYNARFDKDDAEYARLLRVLADALQTATSATQPSTGRPARVVDALRIGGER